MRGWGSQALTDASTPPPPSADSYGTGRLEGRSEELLGRFYRELDDPRARRGVILATKLAAYPTRESPRVSAASLARS